MLDIDAAFLATDEGSDDFFKKKGIDTDEINGDNQGQTRIKHENIINDSIQEFIENEEMIVCENISESKFESPSISNIPSKAK